MSKDRPKKVVDLIGPHLNHPKRFVFHGRHLITGEDYIAEITGHGHWSEKLHMYPLAELQTTDPELYSYCVDEIARRKQ